MMQQPSPEQRMTIRTHEVKRGPTYWVKHGVERPNGTLWGIGAPDSDPNCHLPKLFDDPAYCDRLIRCLYDKKRWDPAKDGELRTVRVALIRVDAKDKNAGEIPEQKKLAGPVRTPRAALRKPKKRRKRNVR